ncbi:unnamed protein product [Rotaria sp. Silwood1]|nr:unnamed protein product [Rotaria sp. Silwood1]
MNFDPLQKSKCPIDFSINVAEPKVVEYESEICFSRIKNRAFTKWIGVQLTIASTFHWLTESEQLRSKIIAQLSTYTDGNKGGQISYTLNQTFLNG